MSHSVVLRLLVCIALAWVCALGCSAEVSPSNDVGTTVITPTDAEVDDAGPTVDAGSKGPPSPQVSGSPLCNAYTWMGCYPDDQHVSRDKDCSGNVDGVDASSSVDTATVACHVQAPGSAPPGPSCTLAGPGTDGMSCDAPADCAVGYECVGAGVCRRYCCAGDCSSQNAFCDIQPLAGDPGTNVPVCMPIHDCGLLDQPTDAGACAVGQTCSVVRNNGARSCVATGTAQAGDSCDTNDCGAGLVCLGSSGARRCYVLCHTSGGSPECSHKQSCKGGLPLFQLPGVGICQ